MLTQIIQPERKALGRVYALLVRLAQQKRTATVAAAAAHELNNPAREIKPASILRRTEEGFNNREVEDEISEG